MIQGTAGEADAVDNVAGVENSKKVTECCTTEATLADELYT